MKLLCTLLMDQSTIKNENIKFEPRHEKMYSNISNLIKHKSACKVAEIKYGTLGNRNKRYQPTNAANNKGTGIIVIA